GWADRAPFRTWTFAAVQHRHKTNRVIVRIVVKQQRFIDEGQCLAQVVERARESRPDLRVWNIMPASLDPLDNASERQFCALQANEDENDRVTVRLAFLQKLQLRTLRIGEHRFHEKRDAPSS